MWDALCWAMREAKAGRFSATDAVDALRERWTDAIGGQYRGRDPDEFDRMLRDAVAAADADGTCEELAARAHGFTDAETCRVALDVIDSWAPTIMNAPNDASDRSPSWAPVDVRAARDSRSVLLPTILTRADGPCLFYRGRIHSVHGETESGKSWLVQCATAECLLIGEPVLYLDFEDEAGAVAERLIRLGVPVDVVENPALFVYVHPETPPTTERERQAFDALLNGTYSLAVVDGVTDSMALFGLSGMDADDVARWHRELPKAVAHRTGAAVACVDHVAKDSQTRGRFALGSQHKIAGLSGAAYVVEMEQPFAVGQAGRASVRVGKDRPGRVRGLGTRWRKSDRTQHVADLLLDSTDTDRTVWALDPPSRGGVSTDTDGKPSKGAFRPTWFMEQVSRYWEETDDPAKRTNSKTVDAMCAERKEQGKTQHRNMWREAIKVLEAEGFAGSEDGPRDSLVYSVVKPYRQHDDPLSDEYAEAGGQDVDNWKVQLKNDHEGGEG
ncbi:AAA family ATPase [Mycolicibacterium arabiense]|nr:AAA family ATPase [Mycolicibacterium arabiense]